MCLSSPSLLQAGGTNRTLIVFDRRLPLFSTGDAGAYTLVLQCFSEPVGIMAAITEQPLVRPIRRPRPLFHGHAGRRSVGLQRDKRRWRRGVKLAIPILPPPHSQQEARYHADVSLPPPHVARRSSPPRSGGCPHHPSIAAAARARHSHA